MRLGVLERADRLPARALQRLVALLSRHELDDVARTGMHRPAFWGRPFFAFAPDVLRGPSYWTAGEREYMAAFVSRLNECRFCARVHTEVTRIESRGEVDADAGSFTRPELGPVLPLLEKVTRTPDLVTAADVEAVRAAGVPDEAIIDALDVSLVFNTVNRMANAFGWSWDSESHLRTGARAIHVLGYKLPGFALR